MTKGMLFCRGGNFFSCIPFSPSISLPCHFISTGDVVFYRNDYWTTEKKYLEKMEKLSRATFFCV